MSPASRNIPCRRQLRGGQALHRRVRCRNTVCRPRCRRWRLQVGRSIRGRTAFQHGLESRVTGTRCWKPCLGPRYCLRAYTCPAKSHVRSRDGTLRCNTAKGPPKLPGDIRYSQKQKPRGHDRRARTHSHGRIQLHIDANEDCVRDSRMRGVVDRLFSMRRVGIAWRLCNALLPWSDSIMSSLVMLGTTATTTTKTNNSIHTNKVELQQIHIQHRPWQLQFRLNGNCIAEPLSQAGNLLIVVAARETQIRFKRVPEHRKDRNC